MKKTILTLAAAIAASAAFSAEFALFKGNSKSLVLVPASEESYVKLAAADLVSDAMKVGGVKLDTVEKPQAQKTPTLYIGTVSNPEFKKLLGELGANAGEIEGKFECYKIFNVGENGLAIVGSEPRGTMFGVYEFTEKFLGVEPLYFFSGLEPEKKSEIVLKDVSIASKEPTVKYRGWFINDEDLLTEFYPTEGDRHIDYVYYNQVVNSKLMRRVFEALVRARFNTAIPASFLDIGNPPEETILKEAVRRGVYVSAHHIEPLGVSGFTFFNYWTAKGKKKEELTFSYFTSKDQMIETWRHYAEKWSKYPDVIWQVGLRGVGDRPMWFADKNIPDSDEYRGKIISEALAKQTEIIKEFDKRANPPITTTLWAEGALLYKQGYIKIPDGVMVIFSDNCPGWKMQDDFNTIDREPNRKYGIYYHHQLWSSGPHLASAVPPSQTYKVVAEAIEKRSAEYVVMNVSNIREFVVGAETSAKMLFDFKSVAPDGGLAAFMNEYFGKHAGKMTDIYNQYYASYAMQTQRNVPMWLDGHLKSETITNLGAVSRAFASKKEMERFINREKNPEKPKQLTKEKREMERFAKVILGDAFPERGTQADEIISTRKQFENFDRTTDAAEQLAYALPARERAFLRENLLGQSYIMRGLSRMANYSLHARAALAQGDVFECLYNLQMVNAAAADTRTGKTIASAGKWADWYRGDKKINFPQIEDKISETLKRAEKAANAQN